MAADLYDLDVKALRDEAEQKQIEQTFEQARAVNLDETTIEEIEVAFVEYKEVEGKGGKKRMRPEVRMATVSTYVPVSLLNAMIAAQQKANKLKARVEAGEIEVENDPMMEMITRQVLAVWKLSEPDMTWERFQKGLDFEKCFGLYSRFFGSTLQKLRSKV